MRDLRAALIALVVASATAHAGDKPDKVDLAAQADKVEVYRDEMGSYYVVPKLDAYDKQGDADQWVFYGDGKTLYRQRVLSSTLKPGDRHWMLWGPRAINLAAGYLEIRDKPSLECRKEKGAPPRALVQLAADEARTLLKKATAYAPLNQRNPHLLARDDEGSYYYIDELRAEYGGNGYRLFIGQKGAMKEVALTNILHDSAGELFATKNGSIKVAGRHDGAVYWVKGDKKIELTSVDPLIDHYLVWRELGIYGSLGAVCEDM